MSKQHGFTLVELMVTLLVLGIAAGGVGLMVDSVRAHDPQAAVDHLRRALETAAARAEIRGHRLALEFAADGYRFAELDRHGEWRPLETGALLAPRQLPNGLDWAGLHIGGKHTLASPLHHHIVFGSRPPRYRLQLRHGNTLHTLDGDMTGRVRHSTARPPASKR